MAFDKATFYASARKSTLFDGTLSTRQVQGTEAILDAWAASGLTDERWLAYMLGTTYHETGRAMYPVPEGGRGKGHPYGVANEHGEVGYGRGYVQLTWDANYAKADKALGLGGKLVADYDLALQPAVAAQILIRGMSEAWFTSFKLSDYLNDHLADYLHARRIVNGMDKAEQIAGYALVFWQAIQAGAHKSDDHSAVAPAPKPAAAPPPAPPMPTFGSDTKADGADPLGGLLSELGSLVGSVIPASLPAGPSPGGAASQPATADTGFNMNPLIIISAIQTFLAYLPKIEKFASAVPELLTKGEHLIADIKKMDVSASIGDIHDLIEDVMQVATDTGVVRVSTADIASVVSQAPHLDAIPKAA